MRLEIEDERDLYRLQRLRRKRIVVKHTVFLASQELKRSLLSSRRLWTKERDPFLGAAAGSPYIVFISTSGM